MRQGIIEGAQTSLAAHLVTLRSTIAAAAQQVYDSWQPGPEGDPELGGGGICDQIAMAISGIMSSNGIDVTEGGHEGDDHSCLVAYDKNESFAIDIDPRHYESGGGYSWTKSPNVTFSPEMVSISEVQRPDWIENEYSGLEDDDEFADKRQLGKSDAIRRHAEANGRTVRDVKASTLNPDDFLGIPRINEESDYDGLEDNDEFEDEGAAECDSCGIAFPLNTPVPDGRLNLYNEIDRLSLILSPHGYHSFWFCSVKCMTAKHRELKAEIINFGGVAANKSLNSRCYSDDSRSILPESGEYAGLEDNDEFEIKSGMTNPVIHIGKYVLSGTYYGDPRDQADVYVNGLHIGDYNDSQMRPLLHLILKRFPQLKIHAEEHGSDVLASISDIAQYLFFSNEIIQLIEESEYAGLEDDDEFENSLQPFTFPDLHFWHYRISGRHSGIIDDDVEISIIDEARWPHWERIDEFDKEAQGHSSLAPLLKILHTEYPQFCSDSVIDAFDDMIGYESWEEVNHICQFLFLNGDWENRNPDTGNPPLTESEYAGLEDADEFKYHSDDCMHCGAEDAPVSTYLFQCQECDNHTCEQCLESNGWTYDYATDTGGVAICPECLATYNTP